jgi:hypothetical protein
MAVKLVFGYAAAISRTAFDCARPASARGPMSWPVAPANVEY